MIAPQTAEDLKEAIRAEALGMGFDAIGFTTPTLAPEARLRLAEFLAQGFHGEMGWLADRAAERSAPRDLWPEVESVVVLGLNYGPEDDPLAVLGQRDHGAVSVYARNRDYHDLVKARLKRLARAVIALSPMELKVFVDTAPVMEKPLAMQAGLGWQGKHTNLVSRDFGSWLFLGEIYLGIALPPDAPESDHCGGCQRCLDICPTKAFVAPYRLDARRCISYLTIEHKTHIPAEFRPLIGNRIYGCDDCLAVCPWNKFAQGAVEPGLQPRADLAAPLLAELARLDDTAFRTRFSGSPVKRIGRDRFLRNVLIAIGNSGNPGFVDLLRDRLGDVSPLVRAMAVWALRRLVEDAMLDTLRAAHLAGEGDEAVRAEWG